jgi:hypothetical protein
MDVVEPARDLPAVVPPLGQSVPQGAAHACQHLSQARDAVHLD